MLSRTKTDLATFSIGSPPDSRRMHWTLAENRTGDRIQDLKPCHSPEYEALVDSVRRYRSAEITAAYGRPGYTRRVLTAAKLWVAITAQRLRILS